MYSALYTSFGYASIWGYVHVRVPVHVHFFPDFSSQILIARLRGTNRAEERVDEELEAQSPESL